MDLITKATEIATKAHEGQVRKTDGSPYINHPLAVGEILKEYGFGEEVIAAGIVHDVLEDTEVSESELRAELGDSVVAIVGAVSEDTSLVWEERKEKYVESVATSGEGVMAVSVADKIHNLMSMIEGYEELGPSLWEKFNRGKEKKLWFERLLHIRLLEVWRHPLNDRYGTLIEKVAVLPD